MAMAQEKFDQDPGTMFDASKVPQGDRQAVFQCGMKAVLLADIPEAEVQRLVDMMEGRIASDPKLAKWFQLDATENPARHDQVLEARQGDLPAICQPDEVRRSAIG